MSYFSASKHDTKSKSTAPDSSESSRAPAKAPQDNVSTLGSGMQITGNIICTGSLQIYGRVVGDIHAAQLVICEGARVEGKIIAPEAVIRGTFNGSIHGNVVKLQQTAEVEGEIFNKSLSIEQDARFEGVARRLDNPVEGPSNDQINGAGTAPKKLEIVPDTVPAA